MAFDEPIKKQDIPSEAKQKSDDKRAEDRARENQAGATDMTAKVSDKTAQKHLPEVKIGQTGDQATAYKSLADYQNMLKNPQAMEAVQKREADEVKTAIASKDPAVMRDTLAKNDNATQVVKQAIGQIEKKLPVAKASADKPSSDNG